MPADQPSTATTVPPPPRRRWSGPLMGLLSIQLAALVLVRLTVASPERCGDPTAASLRTSAAAAVDWAVANQRIDGSFLYAFDRQRGDLGGYDSIRHAGITLALFVAAHRLDRTRYLPAGDAAVRWLEDRIARRDDWSAIADGDDAVLGASALLVAALVERRLATGEPTYDDLLRRLGRYLRVLQRTDGGFWIQLDVRTGAIDRTSTSPYYPGEAMWALARLATVFPNEGWDDAAVAAGTYLATQRDAREGVKIPPLNDHWAAYALAELAGAGHRLPAVQIAYAQRLAARFDVLIRAQAQQQAGLPYAWAHGPQRSAAAVGTWVEGQAALVRLARTDRRAARLASRALASASCAAGVLEVRQLRGTGRPELDGAWFTDGTTRLDYQQHSSSGLVALALLEEAR